MSKRVRPRLSPKVITDVIGAYKLLFGTSLLESNADLVALFRSETGEVVEATPVGPLLPILAVLEAAQTLDAEWSVAIDAMDDDNIIPTELWTSWMAAHRKLRAALSALQEPES